MNGVEHYVNVEDVARIHAIALLDPNVNAERLFAFAAPHMASLTS